MNTLKHRNTVYLESRRLEAIRLFKNHMPQSDIARQLSVSRQAVSVWINKNNLKGRIALKSTKATGRPNKLLFPQASKKLKEILHNGAKTYGYETDLWTTYRIRDVLQKQTGITYHYAHVWKLLQKSGFSCQKPERRAIQRNERKIRKWITKTWPDVKKKPENTVQL
jgi:transposase